MDILDKKLVTEYGKCSRKVSVLMPESSVMYTNKQLLCRIMTTVINYDSSYF